MLRFAPEPQAAPFRDSLEPARSAPMPFELAVYDWPFTVHVTLSAWPVGEVGLPAHAIAVAAISRIPSFTNHLA